MSNLTNIVVGTVVLAGLVTAKVLHGRYCRKLASDLGAQLHRENPELLVTIAENQYNRLVLENAPAEEIEDARLKLEMLKAKFSA